MDAEIEHLLRRAAEANRRRDAEALAHLMHPNANYPLPDGTAVVGRAAIAKHLAPLLAMVPEDIEHDTVAQRIHRVTPDVAIIDIVARNYRRTEAGEREAISDEAFTMVAVREEGQWLVAGIRGALVPRKV